ncbi:CCA tRNA nucleotidyltransferase [Candidatus Nanosalina sp. VS9-1]|uniref:CCA tRNA nucleotidyltransferase n=1 Tax=Candidatus Nanosalina sp. VS9-1 TaxID=3388566 RepID=UPI0039E08D8F
MDNSKISWEKIRRKAVDQFYPEQEEFDELERAYEKISGFIQEEFGFETFFAGSAGRKTCMTGDRDLDLFVLFPEDMERRELEQKGLEIGRKVFEEFEGEYEVDYAEHPYTKGVIEGLEVEIVPCYDTDPDDIISAVDRSPHHAKWVRENLSSKQCEDVVLLKAFLRASGIYGSSLKVQGFSGYLCELLIYEFGSFDDLLRSASEWSETEFFDPEDYHDELPENLEKRFRDEPLVVIDPVDSERNVASVLTLENYSRFVYQAWKFSREPGMDFFRREDIDVESFAVRKEIERRGDFIVLEFETPDRPDDILYPQLRKALRRLEDRLEDAGFRIFESGFHVGEEVRILFELDESLPEIYYQKGPKIFHGVEHLEQFTQKYDNTFVKDDRVVAKTEREFSNARNLLKHFLDGEASELEEQGVPGNVAEKIKDFRMVDVFQEDEEWLKFLVRKLRLEQ